MPECWRDKLHKLQVVERPIHGVQHTRSSAAGRLLCLAAGEHAVDVRLGLVRRRLAIDDAVAGQALVCCGTKEV